MEMACVQARALILPLLSQRLQDLDATLRLLLEGLGQLEGGTVEGNITPILAAAQHIGTCAVCQAWLDLEGRYPERGARRERLAHYCCGAMFEAVTNAEYPVQFSCLKDRDFAISWLLNAQSIAKFCPWCGKKLPAVPFEEVQETENDRNASR